MSEKQSVKSEILESVAVEILAKLPVKSLLRFRCVCKSWASSFQTSYFITKHLHNNNRNSNLNLLVKRCYGELFGESGEKFNFFSALSTENGRNFTVEQNIYVPIIETFCPFGCNISGPVNGLICLGYTDKAAIWNPSTREFKTIPTSTAVRRPAGFIAFHYLGFGYDSTTNDYKIVRFVQSLAFVDGNKPDIYQVELYSLKTDSWKEISFPGSFPFGCNSFVSGFYYWNASTKPGGERVIVSFDMANEEFSTLPLPGSGPFPSNCYCNLLDFNGLLGAIIYESEGAEKTLDLWVMNGSWTRQFKIDSVPQIDRPLGLWKHGQIFVESLNNAHMLAEPTSQSFHNELMLFDPATKEFKNLGVDSIMHKMKLVVYTESLVPINGRSEYEEHVIRRPGGEVPLPSPH